MTRRDVKYAILVLLIVGAGVGVALFLINRWLPNLEGL